MILYIRNSCPYCQKVMSWAKQKNIDLEYRDTGYQEHRLELISLAGKTQVPFLVDGQDVMMHESDDIINYIANK